MPAAGGHASTRSDGWIYPMTVVLGRSTASPRGGHWRSPVVTTHLALVIAAVRFIARTVGIGSAPYAPTWNTRSDLEAAFFSQC
jgi:hypothetical protein